MRLVNKNSTSYKLAPAEVYDAHVLSLKKLADIFDVDIKNFL